MHNLQHIVVSALCCVLSLVSVESIGKGACVSSFDNIDISDGLPHNTVQKIFRDSEGYMWFATKDGLGRYDGYNFVTFRESLGKGTISNSKIRCIAEDSEKNIWVGTDYGLNCIDIVNGRISSFFVSDFPLLRSNKINELYFDKSASSLWIATDSGLAVYDCAADDFVILPDIPVFKETVNALCPSDDKSHIYLGSKSGLYRCALRSFAARRMDFAEHFNYNVFSICCDDNGNTWFGSNIAMLSCVKCNSDTAVVLLPPVDTDNSDVVALVENEGVLWLLSKRNGIYFYNLSSNELSPAVNPYGGSNDEKTMLTCGLKDGDGNIWIGSYYKGVFLHSKYLNCFSHTEFRGGEGIIGAIVPYKEGIWLGSDNEGIFYYDLKSKSYRHCHIMDGSTPVRECKPMLMDKGSLWIATESNGIFVLDVQSQKISRQFVADSKDARSLEGNRVNCILRDSKGDIYVGTNGGEGGLGRYDRRDGKFDTFYKTTDGNSVGAVFCVCELSGGNGKKLLVGTRNNGLFRFDTESGLFEPIPVAGRENLSISCIFEDGRQRVWIGTFGQGLIRMDMEGNTREVFDMGGEKGSNNICSIMEDNAGNIWISSFYKLACYDESGDCFVEFDEGNGFPLVHVKPMCGCKLQDGQIFVGGKNGIVGFSPENLSMSGGVVPKVVLTDLLVNNSAVDGQRRKQLVMDKSIVLKHNENNISIMFAALNYVYPEKNVCRYCLKGLDDGWNAVPDQRQVNYSNLAPGKYEFLLSASAGDKRWSEAVSLLTVKVMPAPWLSWWAYLIYAFILTGLFFLWLYYHNEKLRLEHDLIIKDIEERNMDEMYKFKMNLFTNFSHEVRTPLTLILCQLDDLIKEHGSDVPELPGIRKNADKISELVSQVLDFRKNDTDFFTVAASEVDFEPFVREIAIMFMELSRIQNHPLRVNLPGERLKLWFNPMLMEKVFHNVIMNAFKYSAKDSEICIDFEKNAMENSPYRDKVDELVDSAVLVSVYNKGEKIPEDKLTAIFEPFYRLETSLDQVGSGIGLSFNKMIMRCHHSDIWAENTEDGVVFRFLIPVGKAHLSADEIAGSCEPEKDIFEDINNDPDRRTLLVVEDNNEIREYLKEKLSNRYNVVDSENGQEALDILHKIKIDMVVSDVMMPVFDGIRLCRTIKNDNKLNHIPVILLTAYTLDISAKDGISIGADAYIPKPFNYDFLLTQIENIFENNDRMRIAFQKRINPEDMNIKLADYDEEFINRCYDFIKKNLGNADMTIEDFSCEMGMSRVQLYRKIKHLTDLSPSRFVLNIKLKIAAELLLQSDAAVSDVCYKVGFNNLSYFTRCFREIYKISPSEYRQKYNVTNVS